MGGEGAGSAQSYHFVAHLVNDPPNGRDSPAGAASRSAMTENSVMRRALQTSANRSTVAQTAMTATSAACKGRSFRLSIRERSHQPSYVRLLVIMRLPANPD